MHRPLEKGSCVGGGVVTASLSPPGVTLWMEDDSSEVGNGFVPFSTSEATSGGGSLFVMTDMVWMGFPPTEYKGAQLPCEKCPQFRLTASAQRQKGLASFFKNCRNTKNGGKGENDKIPPFGRGQTSSPEPHNRGRSGESADGRPGCGRKGRMANATGTVRLSPAGQDRYDPGAGTSFVGRGRRGIRNSDGP